MAYRYIDHKKRQEVVKSLRFQKANRGMTYDDLVEKYGINRKELCNLINIEDYEPPLWVWVKLDVAVMELAPVCPFHNQVCACDCTEKKIVNRKSKPKTKRAPRIEIALSDPEKARKRLERAIAKIHGNNKV